MFSARSIIVRPATVEPTTLEATAKESVSLASGKSCEILEIGKRTLDSNMVNTSPSSSISVEIFLKSSGGSEMDTISVSVRSLAGPMEEVRLPGEESYK